MKTHIDTKKEPKPPVQEICYPDQTCYADIDPGPRRFHTVRPGYWTRELHNRRELLKWMPKYELCVEVGVQHGDFANEVYWGMTPKELYLIDIWQAHEFYGSEEHNRRLYTHVKTRFSHLDNIHILRFSSPKAARLFEDQSLGFVYIDADHIYENVLQDILAWWPKVRAGGFLVGHDYGNNGNDHSDQNWGVEKAVTECFGRSSNLAYITDPDVEPSSWAVMKPPLEER